MAHSLSGESLLPPHRGTRQLSRASFSLSFFNSFLHVCIVLTITVHWWHLSFPFSSHWAPSPPSQPPSTSMSLSYADIMQEVISVVHLCVWNCNTHAIPRRYPFIFQPSSSHPPLPWPPLDFGWGVDVAVWLRSKQSVILIIWPLMSLCLDLSRASFIRTLISFMRAPPQWLVISCAAPSSLLSHCPLDFQCKISIWMQTFGL